MLTLIIGGAASGKSELAEQRVCRLDGDRVYLATMYPWDEECHARIRKHRSSRAGRGFDTVERYTDIGNAELPENANVLLECLSNLVANELYSPEGKGSEALLPGIRALAEKCRHLTIVSNEVFCGGSEYEDDTLTYLRCLADLNRAIAQEADCVIEAVCGVADYWKGEPLC